MVTDFYQIVDQEWEERLERNPLFATRTGDPRYNDKLPIMNEKYFSDMLKRVEFYLNQITHIDESELNQTDKLNFIIFKKMLTNRQLRIKQKFYRMEMSKVNGFHLTLTQIYKSAPFNNIHDYTNYISRLKQIPEYIDAKIECMIKGLEEGHIAPKITMEGVVGSIRDQIKSEAALSTYYEPFTSIPTSIPSVERENLINLGKQVIESHFFPAYQKMVDFLENTYVPATRDDLAAINLPGGLDFYESCMLYHTTLRLTAKEVYKIGLDEVQRLLLEMEEVIREANFEGSRKEFIQFLRTARDFYVETPEQLMEKVARISKKIDGSLPKLFKTLPRLPYGIEQIPDYAAQGSYTAYYNYGTGDGTRSGTYYVNTYNLKSRGLFEYDALTLHEAVPGHHLQLSLQQENDVPNFRKYENFNAFIEGWALYAERLGFDCGLYQTPYTNFGRLSFEMWRACRLVVDTGIHVFGWSRQKAIEYMIENTALSLLNIENEVDRYISWPGQALAYKIGEIKIRELRKAAENTLGDHFDIREFHDAVLINGSLPLDLLQEQITQWIKMKELL